MRVSKRPRRSLKNILMLWFLGFSVVPLAFLTGYSLVKYEHAIDRELSRRLQGNTREVEEYIRDSHRILSENIFLHASDSSLIYYLSAKSPIPIRELVHGWMLRSIASRISVIRPDGKLIESSYRSSQGEILDEKELAVEQLEVSESILTELQQKPVVHVVDASQENKIDLIIYRSIMSKRNKVVGYLEEVMNINSGFINKLNRALDVDVVLFNEMAQPIASSSPDFMLYPAEFFKNFTASQPRMFDITIRETPFGMMLQNLPWGTKHLLVGLAVSKKEAKATLKNVTLAFISVVGIIIILLVITTAVASKLFLRPITELVGAIETIQHGDTAFVELAVRGDTELGLLTENFNKMSKRISMASDQLNKKIKELETSNKELVETQSQLVQSAKMASLGQLVAGIAHELNNPIGFIYSNIDHLQEYFGKLISLIDTASRDIEKLEGEKTRADYDFIKKDLPKLIRSCAEGAKRVRDIVIGLRNFSRLDEAKLKEVDIHEGLESTLTLLSGELKSKVEIHRSYSELPKVTCFPSQLNQVFMNILTNAAQAIEQKGDIWITTRLDSSQDKPLAVIAIRDNGKGMSPEIASQIFDPFFTTKNTGLGTGLGLSISYGILRRHDGTIEVNSELAKGSEFQIRIPVAGPKV